MSGHDIPLERAGAELIIDLGAIAGNYRTLQSRLGAAECGAVVKADGYGLGARKVAAALAEAGARVFFVAHVEEGIRLRKALPDVEIHILNGLLAGAAAEYREHALVPVLGGLAEIKAWKSFCGDTPLPCDVHVDTGMLRLGLPPDELETIASDPDRVAGLDIRLVMSHLASSEERESPQNPRQLAAFAAARRILPMGRASFANSSGIFLSPEYHFDLARPGVALYGVNPQPGRPNPMTQPVTLRGRVQQVRKARAGETVGYGASHEIRTEARVATVAIGYADGYLRSLSNRSYGFMGATRIPLIGRVSMDLITFDVSEVPEERCRPGDWIELIGPHRSVDDVAAEAGTIGYEILTSLGHRYHRNYVGAGT